MFVRVSVFFKVVLEELGAELNKAHGHTFN